MDHVADGRAILSTDQGASRPIDGAGDVLVVLSHLRWDWVWQRPQHLISRLGRDRSTFVLEEPRPTSGAERSATRQPCGDVTRLWLEVPSEETWLGFREADHAEHERLLRSVLPPQPSSVVVWMYTALALDLALALEPDVLVYDVMDDLASFKDAAPHQRLRHQAALHKADLVFTGGRSLHSSVTPVRAHDVHCFPSGVEVEHFARAKALRAPRPAGERPVAGYVGVLDERVDWQLVGELADALPSWSFVMVGPTAKVDASALPVRANLHYVGPRPYAELPDVMASFDVALMPFARNDATRSISPTKTLEYLAAGLPVVSTPIADVVADFSSVVRIAEDAPAMASACVESLRGGPRAADVAEVVGRCHWDSIATRMGALVDQRLARAASRRVARRA